MHAPNHGHPVKVTIIGEFGEQSFKDDGYLALSTRARVHSRDTGLVLLNGTSRSVMSVFTTDRIELI